MIICAADFATFYVCQLAFNDIPAKSFSIQYGARSGPDAVSREYACTAIRSILFFI